MFRALLRGLGWRAEDSSSDDEAAPINDIQIPKVQTGLSTKHKLDTAKAGQLLAEESIPEVEKIEGIGSITTMDNSSGVGIIDRMFRFEIDEFCLPGTQFDRGSNVEYVAVRSGLEPQWRVVSMKLYKTEAEALADQFSRIRKEVVIVKQVGRTDIEVEAGCDVKREGTRTSKTPRRITIPLDIAQADFLWMRGDWMIVCLEDLSDEPNDDGDIPSQHSRSRIISLQPLSQKELVGKVSRRSQHYLIDNTVLFQPEFCKEKRFFPVGTSVQCLAIESSQRMGNLNIRWRAIDVKRATVMNNSDTSATTSQEKEANWGEAEDGAGGSNVSEYGELFTNKNGIEIHPRTLVFPETLLGNVARQSFLLKNKSPTEVRLLKIHLSQDQSHSQFDIVVNQNGTGDIVLSPNEELYMEVLCQPRMLGKTKEICVFDFGDFVIGRHLAATGYTEDELLLKTPAADSNRATFQKQTGEQNIDKIITDRERRRIRGNQAIRSAFFVDKRIPANRVPSALYKIVNDQDEDELTRLYPDVMSELSYENYKGKFRVSLWLEEIENDVRRRQYDLRSVRLTRISSYPVHYKFPCLGVLDFQPPVNIFDTIDAFDTDDPNNAKFQGTVQRLNEDEVICSFGDVFDQTYTGFPLTIQFNLSRTSFKRCHFAVESAFDCFDQEFLFPGPDVVTKPPRIVTYEDEEEKGLEDGKESPACDLEPGSIFRKPDPGRMSNRDKNSSNTEEPSGSSTSQMVSKRIQSLRSRFTSSTASGPSNPTAKLVWFNTSLNQEQKNAVRRILRGQARPIPYIIFGPPGTGKTVTLVEAVMQINKLDTNSRVLVCGPSNASADIIAEYLVQSGEYLPGDFIRLNGFLRAGQMSSSTILQPFCVDGEDINNVAMHRLIVSTCMTAGQFFQLGLETGHFTHVFVDEAGYCTEPDTMVPAILIAASRGGQLILAGDPNQLGPVLMSDVSQNCGLSKSFLERLMERNLYQRNTDRFGEEKYNPLVLTKLVKNYRTHSVLLKLPSQLFYDDDLIASASYEDSYALTQDPRVTDNILVSPTVPLVVNGVQGQCVREHDSPSWCNIVEAMQVAKYVHTLITKCGLTAEDIGVITPYRKQVEKIRAALTLNLPSSTSLPKVASVEEFQGGERTVIIISTVRSSNEDVKDPKTDRLAFIYQPKRFNVLITRAKALMIVVGNPHVLAQNEYWRQLLQRAIQLKAYTGCNLPLSLDPNITTLCNSMSNRASVPEEQFKPAAESEKESNNGSEEILVEA